MVNDSHIATSNAFDALRQAVKELEEVLVVWLQEQTGGKKNLKIRKKNVFFKMYCQVTEELWLVVFL